MSSLARKRAAPQLAVGLSLFDASGGVVGVAACVPPPAAAAAAPGLSLVHTDTLTASPEVGSFIVRVPLGGGVVRLTRVQGPRGRDDVPPIKRGEIKGLSAAAALRLRRSMMSVDQSRVRFGFFVGNTLPAGEFQWPDVTVFLRRYRARFERRWPGTPAFWVKELTDGGTPHLHLVVLWLSSPPSLREFRKWNDNAWADVVCSTHPSHRTVACSVDAVRSYAGSAAYLSGYLTQAKKIVHDDGSVEEGQRQSDTGKMWGCIGKRFLPIRWETDTMTAEQGEKTTRIMRRWREKKGTFWLHSRATYSMKERRGVPTEHWQRFDKTFGKAFSPGSFADERWVALHKESGYRIRRCCPRLFRRLTRDVWSLDVESGKYENNGTEIHSACSGWHFIGVADFAKVVRFVKGVGPVPLTTCEKRWVENGQVGSVQRLRGVRIDGSRLAGGRAPPGSSFIGRADLRSLYECGRVDASPVEQSPSS